MPISKIKGSAINDDAITTAKIVDDAVTSAKVTDNIEFTGTHIKVPSGTTAQRPGSPAVGYVRYNTTTGVLEQYMVDGWQSITVPPIISSLNIDNFDEVDDPQTLVITGANFDSAATAVLLDSGGNTVTPTTSTRDSSSQITIVFSGGDVITSDNGPYDVKVTTGTGLTATTENALTLDNRPAWTTASGNVGTVYEDVAISTITVVATDPEGESVTYSITSGALPTGLSLSSGGAITGTPNVNDTYNASGITHNFTVTADDGTGNTTPQSFNILRKWNDGSTSAQAISSLSDFDAIATGDTGYNTRYVTLNGSLSAFEMDTYTTSGGDTFYVVSPVFGSGGINVVNDSVAAMSPGGGNGSFKTIVGSQTRTVNMGGNFSAFSSKTAYNIYTPNTPSTYVDTVTNIHGSGYQGGAQTDICGDFRGGGRIELSPYDTRLGYQTLNWYFHGTGGNANSSEITALRNIVTELSILTPWTTVVGDDDGQSGTYSNTWNDNSDYVGSTPSGFWLKDASGNIQKTTVGYSNTNEHMYVSMWTHNDHDHKVSSNDLADLFSGSPSYTNGLLSAGMILADEYDGRVGGTSTTTLGPAYNSTLGFRNNRNPMLVR